MSRSFNFFSVAKLLTGLVCNLAARDEQLLPGVFHSGPRLPVACRDVVRHGATLPASSHTLPASTEGWSLLADWALSVLPQLFNLKALMLEDSSTCPQVPIQRASYLVALTQQVTRHATSDATPTAL